MKYKIRDGIILEEICGQNILISTMEAREACPYLTQLNESSTFIWKMLEKGINIEDMIGIIAGEYEISENEAYKGLEAFLTSMKEQNFLVMEADNV